jgi:hypothetical protein
MNIMATARYNAFRDNLGNPHIEHRAIDTPEYHAAVAQLGEHMLAISADPKGSDPAKYLSLGDAYELNQLVGKLDEAGWPNAMDIEMRSMRGVRLSGPLLLDKIPIWGKPLNDAKNFMWLAKRTYLPRRGEPHKGYEIGELATSRKQRVVLCDDGKLRSYRSGKTLRQSMGTGWGRLPDPDYLNPALSIGQLHGVDYNNRRGLSLKAIIEEKSGITADATYKPAQPSAIKQAGQALRTETAAQVKNAWSNEKAVWKRRRFSHQLARLALRTELREQAREAWDDQQVNLWVAAQQAKGLAISAAAKLKGASGRLRRK